VAAVEPGERPVSPDKAGRPADTKAERRANRNNQARQEIRENPGEKVHTPACRRLPVESDSSGACQWTADGESVINTGKEGTKMQRFSHDFEERLRHFGLDRKLLKKEITLGGAVSWDDQGAPFPVKVIKTNDLDEIKNLIGIPDQSFEKGSLKEEPKHVEAASLKTVTPDNVAQIAHSYVFGNSQKIRQHKKDIEKAIGEVNLQVASAETIIIDKKIVISGSQSKAIIADQVIFKDEGQIICEGILTLNAGTLINQDT
jgi:hypothetical protein